jgi:hypothetical protein
MGLIVNTDGLTLEELMKKETEIRKKLSIASRVSSSPIVIDQLYQMIEDVKLAMLELQFKKSVIKDDDDDSFTDYLNIG